MDLRFLTLTEVLLIHEDQLAVYGGISGVRDRELLQSAMGNVEATFAGEYLHQSIFEMAAAYLYGICRNHLSSMETSARRSPARLRFSVSAD